MLTTLGLWFMQSRPLVSGGPFIGVLLNILIIGVIFGLLWWLIGYCSIPEPFNKVARVILAIVAVIFLINVLLSLSGTRLF